MAQQQQTDPHANNPVSGQQNGKLPPSKSSGAPRSTNNQNQTVSAEEKNDDPDGFLSRWQKPEWVIVYVTAAYTAIALLTLFAIGWQVWLMRVTARRQLRAYMVAETGTIVNVANPIREKGKYIPTEARITHPGWGPVARIQIKNTGQTPAYNVEHWGKICFLEYPLPASHTEKPTFEGRFSSVVGPGIPNTKTLFFGPRLTDEQTKKLMDGTGAIYVFGEIVYTDTFREHHFTRYRLIHHVQGGKIGINTDFSFAESGNETDDSKKRWYQRRKRQLPVASSPSPNPSPAAEAGHGDQTQHEAEKTN